MNKFTFIAELVEEWREEYITDGDVQDIIEGYCLSNGYNYETVYNAFIRMRG